jgi:hypothetical protein
MKIILPYWTFLSRSFLFTRNFFIFFLTSASKICQNRHGYQSNRRSRGRRETQRDKRKEKKSKQQKYTHESISRPCIWEMYNLCSPDVMIVCLDPRPTVQIILLCVSVQTILPVAGSLLVPSPSNFTVQDNGGPKVESYCQEYNAQVKTGAPLKVTLSALGGSGGREGRHVNYHSYLGDARIFHPATTVPQHMENRC